MLERSYQTRQGTIRYWVSARPSRDRAGLSAGPDGGSPAVPDAVLLFCIPPAPAGVGRTGPRGLPPICPGFLPDGTGRVAPRDLGSGENGRACIDRSVHGGYLAQCFMERFPGQARGFISIDSAPLQRRYVTAAELWALRRCELLYRCYPWSILRKAGARGCAETAQGQTLMKEMMDCYSKREFSALAGHGFRALAEAMAADLPYKVDCPALLLCGERDRAGLTRRYNRRWSEETGIPLVWLQSAGHNSNTDVPDQVNSIIQGFLREHGV